MLQGAVSNNDFNVAAAAAAREAHRLEALDRYDILDTPREGAFDRIVRLAKRIFDMPVAIVSVIDAHRQWYKAVDGLSDCEAARPDTFCNYTIKGSGHLIVPDARLDPRFARNPFVTAAPFVRAYAGVPLKSSDGQNIGTLCLIDFKPRLFTRADEEFLVDLAQIAMSEFELRRTAATDVLTGLLSRRAFKEMGEREVALAQRHRHNLNCIAIDLDLFKSVNDRFGHAAGDAVLVGAAQTLRKQLRDTDLLGRIGGEEFVALVSHTERAGALEVAEKMRAALERQSYVFGGQQVTVTGSFGVSTLDITGRHLEQMMENADVAVYQAKQGGRNRVVAWRAKDGEGRAVGRRVLKAGLITFNNRHSTIDCTVRTLGDDGAGLDVSSSVGIPDRFELTIRADGLQTPCRVVARADRHLDVEFA